MSKLYRTNAAKKTHRRIINEGASYIHHHTTCFRPKVIDIGTLFSANTLKYCKALSKPLSTHPDSLAMTIDAHFCIKKTPNQVKPFLCKTFLPRFYFIHSVKIHSHSFQTSGKTEVPLVPSCGAWLGFWGPFGCLMFGWNVTTLCCQVTQAAGHGLPGGVAEHQESVVPRGSDYLQGFPWCHKHEIAII